MLALIDGDIIVYKVGFACETHYYDVFIKGDEHLGSMFTTESAKERNAWIEENIGSKDDVTIGERFIADKLENCLHSVKLQIEFILQRTEAKEYRIFLTGEGNFREDLVDYYKESRRDKRKPTYYQEIRDYLVNIWNAEVIDGQEADDQLGIEQYKDYKQAWIDCLDFDDACLQENCETIICTIDKDLDNIPGWHFNFDKDIKYWVDEDEALRNFYTQLLTGDPSDDIPGIYKITGQKCTKKILEPISYCETEQGMWEYVKHVYVKYFVDNKSPYLDISYSDPQGIINKIIEIGQLLWIRREEGKLWAPPM